MRSNSKIPPLWTIVNWRQYIEFVWSRYVSWHKRNFIKVKCLKCWLEVEIEAKWFFNYWCRCVRLEEKKRTKHWFQSIDNPELHRFYNIYCWIKTRCKGTAWWDANKWYFDKWIKCERLKFEDFKNDMFENYCKHIKKYWIKNTTIDRIDPNKNYNKENCRRATIDEQNFNKSITNFVTIDWIKYDWKMLAERCWISRSTACHRISKYLHWNITYSNLILQWFHGKEKLQTEIDWKVYFSKDIKDITWINSRSARWRLRDYIDWKITKEKLLAKKSR